MEEVEPQIFSVEGGWECGANKQETLLISHATV